MKIKPPTALNENEWLDALFSSTTRVGLELAGYHSRFAPEPLWETGPHSIQEHLVYFITEGRCSAILDGKRVSPSAGSFCWISPTTPFRFIRGAQDPTLVIYRFRFSVEKGNQALRPGAFRFISEAWHLLDTIKHIILEAEGPGKFGTWKVRSLLSLLSILVFEASPSEKQNGTFLTDAERAKIAVLLAENTAGRAAPADLARHLGYSPGYFSRIFRRSYGLSPRTWLLQQRLRHASVLLRESNDRISNVAAKLGYPEIYLFSRQFHQMFGVSPKQYRRRTSR